MKRLAVLFASICYVFLLTGCIGEEYDFSPPTVFLDSDSRMEQIELQEANINWNSDKEYKKETKDILSLARKQQQYIVKTGGRDYLTFDSQDFAIDKINVSLWKDGKQTPLEINDDDRSFHLPKQDGEYIIDVTLHTDSGTAQYVGNLLIK
ncbi:hypothetical protein SFC65_19515 [Priestia filamentosa]|uniref:hypothetical protein n=1 Tax=Priestia filamentosa TaxID=1402861 RepID=UPI003981C9BB